MDRAYQAIVTIVSHVVVALNHLAEALYYYPSYVRANGYRVLVWYDRLTRIQKIGIYASIWIRNRIYDIAAPVFRIGMWARIRTKKWQDAWRVEV